MALDAKTFEFELITPDRRVLRTAAVSVIFPAHDGEMGVLPRRAPMLVKLGIGVCRVDTAAEEKRYYIDGGFAWMLDNCLTLLTEDARSPDEVDRTAIRDRLAAVQSRSAPTLDEQERRMADLERAKAQLQLVQT